MWLIHNAWYYLYFFKGLYDTQNLDYTLNGSELCLTCTFILHSTVKGCTASILQINTLYHVILEIPKANNSAEECLTLSENGTYQISVYDWEKDGLISVKPAVVERIVINEITSTSSMLRFSQLIIICSCVVVNVVVHCLNCVFTVVTLVTQLYVCHCLHPNENIFGLPIRRFVFIIECTNLKIQYH